MIGFIFSNPVSLDPSMAMAKGWDFMQSISLDLIYGANAPFIMQLVLVLAAA